MQDVRQVPRAPTAPKLHELAGSRSATATSSSCCSDHNTIFRWIQTYAAELEKRIRRDRSVRTRSRYAVWDLSSCTAAKTATIRLSLWRSPNELLDVALCATEERW